MLDRLFPRQADNGFTGHRAALWVLGLYIALKLVMSGNSIFNTAAVAMGADGLPLDSFGPDGARAVLMLFALMSLGQLFLALIALTVLVRYRALVPFIYLVLICEQICRRAIVASYAVSRTEDMDISGYVNFGLLALTILGLVLSLIPVRRRDNAAGA